MDVLPEPGALVPPHEHVLGNEREDGRERYKYYRDRGYPLFHHDLENWEEQ